MLAIYNDTMKPAIFYKLLPLVCQLQTWVEHCYPNSKFIRERQLTLMLFVIFQFLPSPKPSPSTAILPAPSPDNCITSTHLRILYFFCHSLFQLLWLYISLFLADKYSCPICKRRFSGHTSLKVHMETIHHGKWFSHSTNSSFVILYGYV